jgi:ketosteroid isomerase-like protein
VDTEQAVRRWIDAWLNGWRALDPEPIVAVYAEDAPPSSGARTFARTAVT